MKSYLFICYFFFLADIFGLSQYQGLFNNAYIQYPAIPRGLLEAVAWSNTRMVHFDGSQAESCSGMPKALGIMGLFVDGKGYFRENASLVASLSDISISEQLSNPQDQIIAYAASFDTLYQYALLQNYSEPKALYYALAQLSEIPDSGAVNSYALDAQIFQIMRFMTDHDFASQHQFTRKNYALKHVFGLANYKILSAPKVFFSSTAITNEQGDEFSVSLSKSGEYGPALWNPAPSCNYNTRGSTAISAFTVHTTQGSYAGSISWSQNCSSNVSFHYIIRSSDGQVTQMVLEANRAWHVGTENSYTIGCEHEGYVDNPTWYTDAMYASSADLARDVVNSGYGIPPLRTFFGTATVGINTLGACTRIKGHQHYPNQSHTDPGVNWDWERYYQLINQNPSITSITAASGTHYDSGGASGNYSNDQRLLWCIQPPGASSVTITFTQFDLENNWDFLFVYDGSTTSAPLLGRYTGTTLPPTLTSSTGNLLIEFRSDCATTAAGWTINYTSSSTTPPPPPPPPPLPSPPQTTIIAGSSWKTGDFTASITDISSQSTIQERYFLALDRPNSSSEWTGQANYGFLTESFNTLSTWTQQEGTFTLNSGKVENNDVSNSNTNLYHSLTQSNASSYLYEWTQRFIGSGTNQRAGLHFMCSDPTLSNRGNSYFVFLREGNDKVQIYSVSNNVFTLRTDDTYLIDNHTDYHVRLTFSPANGWIRVYINGDLVSYWQDSNPLQSGNSVSFRTANAQVQFDDLHVYRSRAGDVSVSVSSLGWMRYQSVGGIPTGRLYALSRDVNAWSPVVSSDYLIDWSDPVGSWIHDGTAADIDSFEGNSISANWSFSDVHSGISQYEYAIGTNPNTTNVVGWTSVGTLTNFTIPFTSGIVGQLYYVSVRAKNGANLQAQMTSNGQQYQDNSSPPLPPCTITGIQTLCQDSTISLSASATGGVWATSNPTIASVTTSGMVTGISTGTIYITYGSSDQCSGTATHSITVNFCGGSPPPPPLPTAPQTTIVSNTIWKTGNFEAIINDVSSPSPIQERYFLIADRSNALSEWKAQGNHGFLYENFNELDNWTQQDGTFIINNGKVETNDALNDNTNMFHSVVQSNTSDYLYEWTQRFTGSGTNQRAGLHFMCSDPTLSNRGNSYFVFLREGSDKVQIYSVLNNVFTLQTDEIFSINNHIDYQIRVTFSPTNGWIRVYINSTLVSSWQDANPLQSGNSVSFRTANAQVVFDDFRVYKNRTGNVSVSVHDTGLMRYQSVGAVATGKILALSRNSNDWSPVASSDILIDWSSPMLEWIHDGTQADIDTFFASVISGNWSFLDEHSGIVGYEYAVGTTPNNSDIIPWTSAGIAPGFTELIDGILDQSYYVSIRAKNAAGLVTQASSDGQIYTNNVPPTPTPPDNDPPSPPTIEVSIGESEMQKIVVYPNPFNEWIQIKNLQQNAIIVLCDMNGKQIWTKISDQTNEFIPMHDISHGVYQLTVFYENTIQNYKLVKMK